MITYDINLGNMVVGVIGAAITAILIYLVKTVRHLVTLIERHEKVLFGDPDIEDWVGLVKICLSNKRYSINDRKALILIVSKLCKNKVIEMDEELKESLDILKKE